MKFTELSPEAQDLVTEQQVKFRGLARVVDRERELIISTLTGLVDHGLSHRQAAELIATEFEINDPDLLVAVNVTRAGRG